MDQEEACENFIKEGRVTVNGNVAKLGTKVSNEDLVEFDNKVIELKEVILRLLLLINQKAFYHQQLERKKFQLFMITCLTC